VQRLVKFGLCLDVLLGISNVRAVTGHRWRRIADLSLQCFDEDMSTAAAQAERFFSEVIAHGIVWSIQDDEGFPTSTNLDGQTAMPFWSLESRAQKVIDNAITYSGFRTCRLELSEFLDR
jgi:hypothetical protein